MLRWNSPLTSEVSRVSEVKLIVSIFDDFILMAVGRWPYDNPHTQYTLHYRNYCITSTTPDTDNRCPCWCRPQTNNNYYWSEVPTQLLQRLLSMLWAFTLTVIYP